MILEIIHELEQAGQNPLDFNITIFEGGCKVEPRYSFEPRMIAKEEDRPIIQDINDVAELTTLTAIDKDEIAEMLVFALQRIDELEDRLNG